MSRAREIRSERAVREALRRPAARPAAALLLLWFAAALSGCAAGLVSHRSEPPVPASATGVHGVVSERADAVAQSAADPREPYWPYRLGELELAQDSLDAAETALKASLSREATYAPALALLSKLYYRAGRHREAVAMLEPVRAHPEAYPEAARQVLLAGLALHEEALGRADLAGTAIATAPPGVGQAGSAAVYVLLRGERPDSAAALAAEAVREDPRSAVNQNNYGITRLRAGDPASARRAFLAAIERDPDLPGPYYNLAILEKYYLLEDDDAAHWFEAYWKRSHADPDSLSGVFAGGPQKPVVQRGN